MKVASWTFMLAGVQPLDIEEARLAAQIALAEDVGDGDVTTQATVPESSQASAVMRAREPLIVAGLTVAEETFASLSAKVRFDRAAQDGERLGEGAVLLKVWGPASVLLTAERVALNFVQRLSGIATMTGRFVEAVKGTQARILDTRKTTPGWRHLEKYAVACGGGQNHRFGLFDQVLIKDNHLVALREAQPNPVAAAIGLARARYPQLKVEVEADTLEQVDQALEAGADWILLDNMEVARIARAVEMCRGRALTEASGGVTLATIRAIAQTGVDYISVGALTHSAPAVDVGLDFDIPEGR